ncbi:hypothetical protein AAVH_05762 [Aphelenchoides avenae]|nr:hypothetical protein AAVH_05762 [Aphelenchus avenae]
MRNHPPSYAWQYIKRLPEGNMLCTLCNSFLATHYPTNAKNHLRRRHGLYGPTPNPQPVDAKDDDAVKTFLESIGIPAANAEASPVLHLQSSSSAHSDNGVKAQRPKAPTKRLNLEKKVQALTQAVQSTSTSQVGSPGNNVVEMVDSPSSEENRGLTPDNVRLIRVLANPDTSWAILEDPDWLELIAGDRDWKVPTDRFVAMDLMLEAANQAHERIKYDLSRAKSKVAVIVNMRTSATSDPVCTGPLMVMVTVHFLNDDLRPQKAYLGSATCYDSVRAAVDNILSSFNIALPDVGAFFVENYTRAVYLPPGLVADGKLTSARLLFWKPKIATNLIVSIQNWTASSPGE